jgi:hypothetical protein
VVTERHLRRIMTTYLHHFHAARPHRTLAQLAPAQAETLWGSTSRSPALNSSSRLVQRVMGHERSATTLDLYTRRSDGEDRILRALAGDNDDKEEPW